VYRRVMW